MLFRSTVVYSAGTSDSVSIAGRAIVSFRLVASESVAGYPKGDTQYIGGTLYSSALETATSIVQAIFEADPTNYDATDNFADFVLRIIKTGKQYTIDSENEPTHDVEYTEE